jgi:hypothetical protein
MPPTAKAAGYSGTPLLTKLGYDKAAAKGGRALLIGADAGPAELLRFKGFAEMKTAANAKRSPAGPFAVIHYFETDAAALAAALPLLRARLASDGMIWVSWPKKASKVPTTITEDVIRKHALGPPTPKGGGLVDVKVCAVDEVWSGLKLVIPVAQR